MQFGLALQGNFEGANVLHRLHARGELARPDDVERARVLLLQARSSRPRPGLDDKVLTEWNAMFLATLAEAALLADNDRWTSAAVANGVFLMENLRDTDGNWHRSWQADASPRARHDSLAHDLAHVVDAFTRLYELTGNERWLLEARDAADHLLENHWDEENLGLFTVSHSGEQLIARQKDIMDNATPSANSTAAWLAAASVTFSTMPRPPWAARASVMPAAPDSVVAVPTTRQPSFARASAIARPMPEAPAVTITRVPSGSKKGSVLMGLGLHACDINQARYRIHGR